VIIDEDVGCIFENTIWFEIAKRMFCPIAKNVGLMKQMDAILIGGRV
jgi:hypothetical protein